MNTQDTITLGMATKLVYREWTDKKIRPVENAKTFEKDVIAVFQLFKSIQGSARGDSR